MRGRGARRCPGGAERPRGASPPDWPSGTAPHRRGRRSCCFAGRPGRSGSSVCGSSPTSACGRASPSDSWSRTPRRWSAPRLRRTSPGDWCCRPGPSAPARPRGRRWGTAGRSKPPASHTASPAPGSSIPSPRTSRESCRPSAVKIDTKKVPRRMAWKHLSLFIERIYIGLRPNPPGLCPGPATFEKVDETFILRFALGPIAGCDGTSPGAPSPDTPPPGFGRS